MTDIFTEHDGMVDISLSGGEVESADEFYSGNRVTKEGFYHVNGTGLTLHKFDAEKKKLPMVEIDLQVLDGSDLEGNQLTEQKDKVINHRIYLAGWEDKLNGVTKPLDDRQQKAIRAFAYAFGLISEADLGKKDVKIPFHLIDGRQAVVKVTREKEWEDDKGNMQKGGLKIAWNNDAWPVTHDRVKDVHKDREALALIVGMSDAGGGASGGGSDLDDI